MSCPDPAGRVSIGQVVVACRVLTFWPVFIDGEDMIKLIKITCPNCGEDIPQIIDGVIDRFNKIIAERTRLEAENKQLWNLLYKLGKDKYGAKTDEFKRWCEQQLKEA